jgi:hypothetical protein
MYTAMDEEVFLAPESIISGVLALELESDPTADLDFAAGSETGWDDLAEHD